MQATRITELLSWLSELDRFSKSSKCTSPNFLKPLHLGMLAIAVQSGGFRGLRLPDALSGYATRMGLWRVLDMPDPESVGARPPQGRFTEMQGLCDARHVPDGAKELVGVLRFSACDRDTVNAMEVSLMETLNNSFDHAQATARWPTS
jgi:hypothetical protein